MAKGKALTGAAASSPGGPSPKKQNITATVEKILRDNFKGWGFSETHSTEVDSKTLFDKLCEDKSSGLVTMGAKYYRDLKAKYRCARNALQEAMSDGPQQPDTELNEGLVKAVVAFQSAQANKHLLREWLSTADACTAREFRAVLACAMACRPSASMSQRTLVLDVMRFVVRVSMDTKFPQMVQAVKSHFAECLCVVYQAMKGMKDPLKQFWELYKQQAASVLDVHDMAKVMDSLDNPRSVAPQLAKIVSNTLGMKLFGPMFHESQHYLISENIDLQLAKIKGQAITSSALHKFTKDCHQSVGQLTVAKHLAPKHTIQLSYRGCQFSIKVGNIVDEAHLKLVSECKAFLVIHHSIEALPFEDGLVDPKHVPIVSGVAEDVSLPIKACREQAKAVLDAAKTGGPEAIKAALDKHEAALTAIDASWNLEAEWLRQMMGESGELKLAEQVSQCFPTAGGQTSPQQCMAALGKVMGSNLYHFVPAGFKGQVGAVKELVHCIENAMAFQGSVHKASKLLKRAMLASEWWLKAGEGATPVYGKPAMEALWKQLEANIKAKKKVTFSMIEPFRVFHWLVSDAQSKVVNEQIALLSKEAGLIESTPKGPTQADKKKKDDKKRKASAIADAMAMFG